MSLSANVTVHSRISGRCVYKHFKYVYRGSNGPGLDPWG